MNYQFADIPCGSSITLMLHSGNMHMKMDATLEKLIREDIGIIRLHTTTQQILKFDNIKIEMVYYAKNGYPYAWRRIKIVYFQGNYVLQAIGEGSRVNRRCTYRVGISRSAYLKTFDGREHQVIVKDVSLTGFSITDRTEDLVLFEGDKATISFEDLGHEIKLQGTVLRIEERETSTIYGFSIVTSCRDLPSYIATKQRRKRNNLPPSYVLESTNDK